MKWPRTADALPKARRPQAFQALNCSHFVLRSACWYVAGGMSDGDASRVRPAASNPTIRLHDSDTPNCQTQLLAISDPKCALYFVEIRFDATSLF
eukprot:scaffold188656_cov19-Prasinocladus_malaysianus.AAC.1